MGIMSIFGAIKRTSSRLRAVVYPGNISFTPYTLTSKERKTSGSSASDISGAEYVPDDRSLRIQLNRDDPACTWAYENEVTVFNSVRRRVGIANNGFDIVYTGSKDNYNREEFEEFKQKVLNELEQRYSLTEKVENMLVNRCLYGFGILRKQVVGNELIRLVELDTSQCIPIRDLSTNELGGDPGMNLDPARPGKSIAMIQRGLKMGYTITGAKVEAMKYYYFTRDEIIPFRNMDRGKFKGVSPVKRVLRLVEIKMTLQNVIDLLVRRFGPQMWLTIGNAEMNLTNAELPPTYYTDNDGNPVDTSTARKKYKDDVFATIESSVGSFSDSTSLMQLSEWGIEPKIFDASSSIMDYKAYMDKIDDLIKTGILGLDLPGRVDVTSSLMQDKLTRDLKDAAMKERGFIENILNDDLFLYFLEKEGKDKGYARLQFKPLDRTEAQTDGEIEKLRSESIYNYMKAGFTKIPPDLKVKWNLSEIEDSLVSAGALKSITKDKISENPDDDLARKNLDDLNKGR